MKRLYYTYRFVFLQYHIDLLYILLFPFQTFIQFKLLSLKCAKHSTGPGNDDLYLIFDGIQIPSGPSTTHSFDIDEGSSIGLYTTGGKLQNGQTVNTWHFVDYSHGGQLQVQLWDYDSIGSDDLLGTINLISSRGGTFNGGFANLFAHYVLTYEVIIMVP